MPVAESNGQLDPDTRFRLPTHVRESKVNCHQAGKTPFAKELAAGKAKIGGCALDTSSELRPVPPPASQLGLGDGQKSATGGRLGCGAVC